MKLLFYKGKESIWDKLICFITRSPYSHVEISDIHDDFGYHMCWSSDAWDGDVRLKRIWYNPDKWDIVEISPERTLDWFDQHKGKKYDFIGLLGTVLKVSWFNSNSKWFCSEIIAEFLNYPDSWKYTPASLYKKVYK